MGSQEGDTVGIPVIDIQHANTEAPKQLLDAATTYGFVFIENVETGFTKQDIDHMFDLSNEFFATPLSVKEEVSIKSNKAGGNVGWLSRGVEKLDPSRQVRPDVKE